MPASLPACPLSSTTAPAQVHPIYGRLLRLLVQQAGADGDAVLAAAGLDPQALMTDDRRLGLETVVRVVQAAIAATGRPWLGLELGAHAPVSAHGSVGFAAVTARDGREALRTLGRFVALRNDACTCRFVEDDAGAALVLEERVPLGPARSFVLDAMAAASLRVLEAAIGPLPAGVTVDLPFPAPEWRAQYERFGAARVRFGAAGLRIAADAATLARPCLGADARAHEAACRACEDALAEQGGDRVAPRVSALLAAALPDGGALPPLPEVAARCGLSPRTLMRRLRAEGTSYQGLVDALRQDRARWLLQHTSRSVERIAEELGFLDTSNFSRTVRRWFGVTPRAVREQARGPR